MYKTILIPLDGSERAAAILPQVETLARCMDSKLILLRVVEPVAAAVTTHDAWPTLYAAEIDHLVKQAENYLTQMCKSYENTGFQVECKLVHGPVVDAIIKVADEIDADLIAMASHGRSGLGSVFYGSVAAGILQRVERPLLLVRSR